MSCFLLSTCLVTVIAMHGQTSRVQVIHNAADAAIEYVDVWLDSTLLLDNLRFRTASSFIDVPSGVPVEIRISDSSSVDTTNPAGLFQFSFTSGMTYVIVANGIVSPNGYVPSPDLSLDLYPMGRETAASAGETDVLFCHGSTDAPPVDIIEMAVQQSALADNLSYGGFEGYLSLDADNYRLRVLDSTRTITVAEFEAPLATLGLEDSALVVVSSGFYNPETNSNGAPFGLFAVLPSGGGFLPLPASEGRIQFIHNAADPSIDTVDIYINGTLIANDFGFRRATSFLNLPSAVDLYVAVTDRNAPGPATPLYDTVITIEANTSYVAIANGTMGSGFNPVAPFLFHVAGAREEAVLGTNTDVLVFHGSTDTPVMDLFENSVLNTTLVQDLDYGVFFPYLELPTSNYSFQVRDETGTNVMAQYVVPFANLHFTGDAITLLASGFLDPEVNNEGPAFGLWIATSNGGDLIALPVTTGTGSVSDASKPLPRIYPNPVTDQLTVANTGRVDRILLTDATGKPLQILRPSSDLTIVELKTLPKGCYYLYLERGKKRSIEKVIVQ